MERQPPRDSLHRDSLHPNMALTNGGNLPRSTRRGHSSPRLPRPSSVESQATAHPPSSDPDPVRRAAVCTGEGQRFE